MSDYETLLDGLENWIETHDVGVQAAVSLLMAHKHWLRNAVFVERCIVWDHEYRMAVIEWPKVTEALAANALVGSGSELAVLRWAVLLATDPYGVSSLDRINRDLVVRATAATFGIALSGGA